MTSKHDHSGPQQRFKWAGFGGVWRWAVGHGKKRWLKVRNWARRRKKLASPKDRDGFRKEIIAANKKLVWFRRHHQHPTTKPDGHHVVMFDGKPCAAWIAKILADARSSGIWKGTMLSGVRTSAESTALCEAMCNAPSCPGRCAGTSSNHNCDDCSYPRGAADCTDPAGLEAYCSTNHRGLVGDGRVLPNDINHFSHTGN